MTSWMRNSRGQMAIFVAMIFQVLFVFFAMAINIALIVHDKINLQNATDLAAFYYAQKQAEVLNAIAHENYQIRQSWKLLAWRYRVLADMGFDQHPINTGAAGESAWNRQGPPTVCITWQPQWRQYATAEDICKQAKTQIPEIPKSPVVAGFLGFNFTIQNIVNNLRDQFQSGCNVAGAINWWFANAIIMAHRMEQMNRKDLIYALARNLTLGQDGEFLDLNGDSVREGTYKTFRKNLSSTNLESLDAGAVQFFMWNSLQMASPGGQPPWLAEIKVAPATFYRDPDNNLSECNTNDIPNQIYPTRAAAQAQAAVYDPQGLLKEWAGKEQDGILGNSVGVEKNPWMMAYVGIKAALKPRQLFWPIGDYVEIHARSFAKPFGGTIGPWYANRWAASALFSTGDKTDAMLPTRGHETGNDPSRMPNYARFPGDRLGLTSNLALTAMRNLPPKGSNALKIDYSWYGTILGAMEPGNPNDILPTANGSVDTPIRRMEIAATSPDLFDITYYSIDPQFSENYYPKLQNLVPKLKANFGLSQNFVLRTDIGMRLPDPEKFTVTEQIELANSEFKGNAFYFVRDKQHLLTGWAPGPGIANYEFPTAIFGKCQVDDGGQEVKNPGSCIVGGRTGYSVKLVSRQYLLSSQHQLGGSSGAIVNPPPPEF